MKYILVFTYFMRVYSFSSILFVDLAFAASVC